MGISFGLPIGPSNGAPATMNRARSMSFSPHSMVKRTRRLIWDRKRLVSYDRAF